jgi:hypothetical protein
MKKSTAGALTGWSATSSSVEILAAYLADNTKARTEAADGDYVHLRPANAKAFSAQDFFIRLAEGRDSVDNIPPAAPEPACGREAPRRSAPKRKLADGSISAPLAESAGE